MKRLFDSVWDDDDPSEDVEPEEKGPLSGWLI